MDNAKPLIVEEFLRSLVDKKSSVHTIRGYQGDLRQFVNFVQEMWPCGQTEDLIVSPEAQGAIQKFIARLKRTYHNQRTVNRKISCLHSFYHWLSETKRFSGENPAKEIPLLVVVPENIFRPTRNDLEQFFRQIDTSTFLGIRDFLMFKLFNTTGMRLPEISHLHISDIAQGSHIVVRSRKRAIPIAIPEALYATLTKYSTRVDHPSKTILFPNHMGETLTVRSIRSRFNKYARKAGVDGLVPYDLRIDYIATAHESGVSNEELSRALDIGIHSLIYTLRRLSKFDKKVRSSYGSSGV